MAISQKSKPNGFIEIEVFNLKIAVFTDDETLVEPEAYQEWANRNSRILN